MEEKAALEGRIALQQGKLAQFSDNDPERHNHISTPPPPAPGSVCIGLRCKGRGPGWVVACCLILPPLHLGCQLDRRARGWRGVGDKRCSCQHFFELWWDEQRISAHSWTAHCAHIIEPERGIIKSCNAADLLCVAPAEEGGQLAKEAANRWLGGFQPPMSVQKCVNVVANMYHLDAVPRDGRKLRADNVEMMRKWMKKRFEGQDQQLETFFTDVSPTPSFPIPSYPSIPCQPSLTRPPADNPISTGRLYPISTHM